MQFITRYNMASFTEEARWKHVVSGLLLATVFIELTSTTAAAHGIPGAETTLEGVPTWLYTAAGGTVIVVSFAILGVFSRREVTDFTYKTKTVSLDIPIARELVSGIFVLLYLAVILTGLLGPNTIQTNAFPVFSTEILWWVGYGIIALVIGDFWHIINPWRTVFEWLGEPSLDRDYPTQFGVWPALIFFLLFVYINMVIAFEPVVVGALAALYGVCMLVGMAIYGKDEWLWHGDAFTRVFDYFGRVGPISLTSDGVVVRKWGVGLVGKPARYTSEVAFIIAMLFTLTFDGYKDTPIYTEYILATRPDSVSISGWTAVMGGVQMFAGLAIFLSAYILFSVLMKRTSGTKQSTTDLAKRFAGTLIPIAGAYHIAHYSLYFFLQHELIIQVLTNPMPGSSIQPEPDLIGFLSVDVVWYFMAGFIVLGHVMAVAVAHYDSLDYFEDARVAIRSQVPMLVLMVCYTMVSLWIISQPFGG